MLNKALSMFTERSFINYAIIGISGVVIDFILYILLTSIGVPAVLASVVSVSAGIVNNFLLNAHYNFKRKDHLWRRFASFYAVGATGVILSALFILLFHNVFGIGEIWAKAISVPFIVVFQYWFNKNSSFALDHKQIPWRQLSIFAICITVLCLFAVNAPYYNFSDEADNLLGAQFITDGGVIYSQYFSHHMPLTYFVGVPFFLLFGAKLIAIKVAFGLVMALWLLAMSRHLLRQYGIKVFASFTLLVAVSQTLAWSHMLLAETLIAFACAHALILLLTTNTKRNLYGEAAAFALLGAIPALSALSYTPLSLAIYALFIVVLVQRKISFRTAVKPLVVFAGVAIVPYLLFVAYLGINRIGNEFIEQALTFNKLYYSQFTTDATTSPLDSLLSIPQGAFGGLQNALLWQGGNKPVAFFFTLAIIASIYLLIRYKQWLIAGAFSVILFFGASRNGFLSVFSNGGSARNGTILVLVGLLLVSIVLFSGYIKKPKEQDLLFSLSKLSIGVALLLIVFASIAQLSTIGRVYGHNLGTLDPNQPFNTRLDVINTVNTANDTYWIAPIDFSSPLLIPSKSASTYRFFAPWHAVCPSCVTTIENDLAANKPNVIIVSRDVEIWGNKVDTYGQKLIDSFENDYYQVADIRLQDYYFNKANSAYIDAVLSAKGYDMERHE